MFIFILFHLIFFSFLVLSRPHTWWSCQQDSFREFATQLGELLRMLQVLHNLLQLCFGFWAAFDVLEGLQTLLRYVLLHKPLPMVRGSQTGGGARACWVSSKTAQEPVSAMHLLQAVVGFATAVRHGLHVK